MFLPSTPFGCLPGADAQLLGDRSEPCEIGPAQVRQQSPSLSNHFEQAAAAGVIQLVRAQVLGQLLDAGGEDRDLNDSGSGVRIMQVVLIDDLLFLFGCQSHDSAPKIDLACRHVRRFLRRQVESSAGIIPES